MASPFNLTLQEVAQIALGGPTLADDNIKILHSLLEYLLRKLDCQEETVTIGGVDAMTTIRDTLDQSRKSTVHIESEQFKPLTKICAKYEKVAALTRSVEKLFERHMRYVTKSDRENTMYRSVFWERFALPTEDTCLHLCAKDDALFPCEPHCQLMKQPDFVNKLMRRSAKPIDERMALISREFDEMEKRFRALLAFASDQRTLVVEIEACVIETEALRKQIADNFNQFNIGLQEIQIFIRAKLNKAYYPEIRMYVRERCAEMMRTMKYLQKRRPVPVKIMSIADQELRCMSCCGLLCDSHVCDAGDKTKNKEADNAPEDRCLCELTTILSEQRNEQHDKSFMRSRSLADISKKSVLSFGNVLN